MRYCISSRLFLEKAGSQLPCEMIFIEDVIKTLNPFVKIKAALKSLIFPKIFTRKLIFGNWKAGNTEDLATIMFTSGSTGEPKGVMLTHSNITSNLEGLYQVFEVERNDKILGVLSFFHSFGFTGTLWFPLIAGIGAVYHYNPLDAKVIGKLIDQHKASILMSTPTFLNSYIRRIEAQQFKTLRFVMVGAEKLRPQLAQEFQSKFHVLPMEGYGCTELSPIVSVNMPDITEQGVLQKAQKSGSIGLPLPGIAVKVIDPDNRQTLDVDQEGLLLVKGPNVMKGYLNAPEKTSHLIIDGWYQTGDVAKIDEDGFITITDRFSRFSKIGGEMVPHINIENKIHEILNTSEQFCVVTAVPDESKGERLIALCLKSINREELFETLRKSGLPNLWIPARDMFFEVDAFDLLGSGKLDLAMIKKRAIQLVKI